MDGSEDRRVDPSPQRREPGYIRTLRDLNEAWSLLQPILLGVLTVSFLAALPFVEALREPYVLGPSGVLISLLSAAAIRRR